MMSCSKISQHFSLGLNSVIHVLILFMFLTVLYFIIISPLSKDVFEHEIKGEVSKSVKKAVAEIPDDAREYIANIINTDIDGRTGLDIIADQYSKPSAVVEEHNKWIQITSIEIITVLVCCLIVVLLVLKVSCNKCTGIMDILKENIITFIFVGIVEYLFFTKIAFKYVPAPPSTLVTTLLETFKKNLV